MHIEKSPREIDFFTVLKPTGHNFSLIVFQQDDIQKTLAKLFQSALHNESNVPLNDSKVISEDLAEMIVTKLCWPNKKTAKKSAQKIYFFSKKINFVSC